MVVGTPSSQCSLIPSLSLGVWMLAVRRALADRGCCLFCLDEVLSYAAFGRPVEGLEVGVLRTLRYGERGLDRVVEALKGVLVKVVGGEGGSGAEEGDLLELCAAREDVVLDLRHARGDGELRQTTAALEGFGGDALEAGGECDALEVAIGEGCCTDLLYGVGQGDALELLVVHGTTEALELIAWEDDLCG